MNVMHIVTSAECKFAPIALVFSTSGGKSYDGRSFYGVAKRKNMQWLLLRVVAPVSLRVQKSQLLEWRLLTEAHVAVWCPIS